MTSKWIHHFDRPHERSDISIYCTFAGNPYIRRRPSALKIHCFSLSFWFALISFRVFAATIHVMTPSVTRSIVNGVRNIADLDSRQTMMCPYKPQSSRQSGDLKHAVKFVSYPPLQCLSSSLVYAQVLVYRRKIADSFGVRRNTPSMRGNVICKLRGIHVLDISSGHFYPSVVRNIELFRSQLCNTLKTPKPSASIILAFGLIYLWVSIRKIVHSKPGRIVVKSLKL